MVTNKGDALESNKPLCKVEFKTMQPVIIVPALDASCLLTIYALPFVGTNEACP